MFLYSVTERVYKLQMFCRLFFCVNCICVVACSIVIIVIRNSFLLVSAIACLQCEIMKVCSEYCYRCQSSDACSLRCLLIRSIPRSKPIFECRCYKFMSRVQLVTVHRAVFCTIFFILFMFITKLIAGHIVFEY